MAGASLLTFVTLCESIAATTKKTAKRQYLQEYFCGQSVESAAFAAIYLTGRPFAAYEERTLQVGGRLLWRVVLEAANMNSADADGAFAQIYRRHGDLGSATAEILANKVAPASSLGLADLSHAFDEISAAHSAAARQHRVKDLLAACSALEAKYVVKIITGDLRIGLRESLVEEAIASAFDVPLEQVRKANMLLGDIGETLRLAHTGKLDEARMRLFHPIGFMLATPAETAQEAFAAFADPHIHIEDKFDGIRAQVHCGGAAQAHKVKIFSRTLDDITGSFPELIPFFAAAPDAVVLDGEILAWENDASNPDGRARPFADLQKRLGRKQVSPELLRSVPVTFVAFDVLFANDELVIDRPLAERMTLLDEIAGSLSSAASTVVTNHLQPAQAHMFEFPEVTSPVPLFLRAPLNTAHSAHELELLFDLAQGRGNEGLMIKDPSSAYTPGRRGGAWLKLKRELATLDVVITAAEFGHGRRAQWLSDYTFAIRDGEELRNVGKAYSGVTDAEIAELTAWCKENTLADYGHVRTVAPEIVLEVAFNNVMISDRHDSGYALRFPRIVRIRRDKSVREIDTLDRVREIYERQKKN